MLSALGWAVAALLAWPAHSQEQEKFLVLDDFQSCGLVTRYASNKIPFNCFQDLTNMRLDEDLSLMRRRGQSRYNATACADSKSVRGLWPFTATDNTRYMVILSSQSMFKTSGGGDCTAITGLNSLSATAEMDCIQSLGRLWCANGSDTPFSWDGTSTATISGMPLGKFVGAFRNRILTANISASLTRLRGSGELDGTDWTIQIPGRSTTPFSMDLSGLNDGKPVTCLMGEYQNAYFIGREDDLFALYGNDRRDFVLRKISDQVGCIEPKSVQEKDNSLIWMSRRGMEKMSGTTISRISDPIRTSIDEIITAAGNTQTDIFTSQADFEGGRASTTSASGPGAPTSTTISPNNVVASSWAATNTANADFDAGSHSSTTAGGGAVSLSSVTNLGFEAASTSSWQTTFSVAPKSESPAVAYGEYFARTDYVGYSPTEIDQTLVVYNVDTGAILKASTTYTSRSNRGPHQMDLSTFTGVSRIYLHTRLDQYPTWYMTSSSFSFYAATFSYSWPTECITSCVDPPCAAMCRYGFDKETDHVYWSSGIFTSQIFDTGFSTPTWGTFQASLSSGTNGRGLTFQVQASTDSDDTFEALTAQSLDIELAAKQARYLRYRGTLTTTISTETPTLQSVDLLARTSAYYITDCVNPGASIASWGLLRANLQANDGSFSFWLSTGTTCHAVTRATATWNAQTINAAIAIPTAPFSAARILFDMDVGTDNPTLNDITWEWTIGSARPPVASALYRDNYYLYYTTSTVSGAANDHALVLDQNDKWTGPFAGITAYSATVYANKLYTGGSGATGRIYQQDVGHDDDGANYTMRFKTPDIDFGAPERLKRFKILYVTLRSEEEPTQNIPLTFRYYVDGGTTSYSLGTVNLDEAAEPGYLTAKLPFPLSSPAEGHWFALDGEYAGSQGPVRIYSMRILYSLADPD